jgi:RNA polymerase sigma-70 factor, ECF subfamily
MAGRHDPLHDPAPLVKRVYAYVAYRIGDGPDAEDVTGEVFVRAAKYRDSYNVRKGEPIGWLLGIARRVLADRGRSPTVPFDDGIDLARDRDPIDELLDRLVLREAVARLPERDRELIALRYGADLSARQIGELTGVATHAVEVAVSRALSRLRAVIASSKGV